MVRKRGPERGSRSPTVSSVTEHVRSPVRVQTAQKAGQVLEIATIWDSFFLRHSKSGRLDKEAFAKRNVKGLQQGVESNGMSMGQMRAGAERGSVALACGPCVPRQRPIKAGRGGGLGQWANSWPRSYECRMSSARNTSPPAAEKLASPWDK